MLNTLKGTFLFMQDGIAAGFRSFKVSNEKRTRTAVPSVNFDAGAEILLKNEIEWNEIDSLFETNARKAEIVDKKIIDILGRLNKQLHSLQEINGFSSNVPKFINKIDSISEELTSLQTVVDEVEDFLAVFEDLIETNEYESKRKREKEEFAAYLEKKTQEMNFEKKKLEENYAEKLAQKEKEIQVTLKERQELFDMAFQQDMQLYKESGIIPNIRGHEVKSNVNLEDVVIEDDLKELDQLLNN